MNKQRLFIFIAVVIVIFAFWNPFGSLSDLQQKLPAPAADEELVASLQQYLEQHHPSPEEFVIDTFAEHDIVFLGEYLRIRENLLFLAGLIPRLYAAGITQLGVEFALHDDQPALDHLISATEYDEELAERILFDYLVIWGYQEYADVFKAAWAFNQTLAAGQPPFRIVGLSVRQDFTQIKTVDDISDPEVLKQVYANGMPDYYMAHVIEEQFIAQQKKALIFAHIHTGFTRFIYQDYKNRRKEQGFDETEKAGQLLYEKYGDRVMNILIHTPLPNDKIYSGIGYPVGGAIDATLARLPAELQRTAFYTRGTPFGQLEITDTSYTLGYDKLLLEDFCDAYLILAPLSQLHAVTAIPHFVNPNNYDLALKNFIGPKDQQMSERDFNKFITDDIEGLQRILNQFR